MTGVHLAWLLLILAAQAGAQDAGEELAVQQYNKAVQIRYAASPNACKHSKAGAPASMTPVAMQTS